MSIDIYSSLSLLTRALQVRGFKVERQVIGTRVVAIFHSPSDGVWMTPVKALHYPFGSAIAKRISVDKDFANQYVQQLGVTIPPTLRLPVEADSIRQFLAVHKQLVVKPFNSHGGLGMSLNIDSDEALQTAIQRAEAISDVVLLQAQVGGDEIRFTIAEGEVVSVLLRQTARLIGDGHSSMTELIAKENEARRNLKIEHITYPQLTGSMLPPEVFKDHRVLADGEILELNKSTMVSGGASIYDISDTIHSSYVATAQRLARNLNPEFLVVDMMIQDYRLPQNKDNYAFIEFNTAPALKMYYIGRDGKQYDIADKLASMIEKRMQI